MPMEKEQGNITLLALMVLLVAAILLGGMAIVPSSLSMSVKHADLVQAQYAAEAGVKRVVAACNALNDGTSINWNWLNSSQSFPGNASYNVTIVNDATGNPPAWGGGVTNGIYQITSTGTANNSSKTVYALVNITTSSFMNGSFPNVTMYCNGDIESNRLFTTNTNGLPVQAGGDIKNVKTSPSADLKPNSSATLPELNYDIYKNSNPKPKLFSKTPTSGQTIYLNDSQGRYYHDGDLILKPTSNINIEGYVDGAILFVKGDVIIDASSAVINFNKPLMIVATGDIEIKNSSAVDVVLYAMGGDVTINSTNWNGGSILADGDIYFNNMQNCNSKSGLLDKFANLFNQMNNQNPAIFTCSIAKWSNKLAGLK